MTTTDLLDLQSTNVPWRKTRARASERERAVGQIKCCPDNGAETRVRTRITFPDTDLHGI